MGIFLFCVCIALTISACSTTKIMVPDSPSASTSLPPATQTAPPVVSQPSVVVPPTTSLPQTGTTPGTPGGYYQGDGPDANPPPNLEATPDPVPVAEPLNKFANEPYVALGQTFVPDKSGKQYAAAGIASWYGKQFHGRKTASGEIYDMYAMSAAHPTLPIPSYARVTNRKNNKSVIVRVNDRGPFHANRVIDLSYTAALKLGYVQQGSTEVIVESITGQDFATNNSAPKPAPAIASSTAQPVVISAPTASSVSDRPVYLQLGVFSNPTNANSFREKIMRDLAWLTDPIEIFIVDKLYRVRLGPYNDNNLARNISSRVKGSLGITPLWAPM
ncbi:MAG: septal ring lytic transglycosylase RlpA family protein [Burkholderiales bacterium]